MKSICLVLPCIVLATLAIAAAIRIDENDEKDINLSDTHTGSFHSHRRLHGRRPHHHHVINYNPGHSCNRNRDRNQNYNHHRHSFHHHDVPTYTHNHYYHRHSPPYHHRTRTPFLFTTTTTVRTPSVPWQRSERLRQTTSTTPATPPSMVENSSTSGYYDEKGNFFDIDVRMDDD